MPRAATAGGGCCWAPLCWPPCSPPWLYLVLAVGIGLGIGAMRRRPDAPKRFTWPAYAVVAILAVPAVILSLYTVRVPHEKVNFLPGTLPYNKTFSYVLSQDNGCIP
jgi:hypothetical protein